MITFTSILDLLPPNADGYYSFNTLAEVIGTSVLTIKRAYDRGAFPGEVVRRGRGRGGERFLHRQQIEAALLANRLPVPHRRARNSYPRQQKT